MSEETLIEAKEVFKSFRIERTETPVLKGVDLKITPRDLLVIEGASGREKVPSSIYWGPWIHRPQGR